MTVAAVCSSQWPDTVTVVGVAFAAAIAYAAYRFTGGD